MAGKDLNRSIKITLDNSDMSSKMTDLASKADTLRGRMTELNDAGKGNSREAQSLKKQYEALSTQMDKQISKVSETDRVLKNLSGATYKELITVKKQLQKELKEEERGTEAFAAKSEQLTRVQEELKNVTGEMNVVNGNFLTKMSSAPGILGQATNGIMGMAKAAMAFIANPIGAVIAAIGVAIGVCVKAFKAFASGSEEGALKASKSLAPLKVVATELGKVFKKFGEIVVDNFAAITKAVYNTMGFLSKYSDTCKEIYDNMTRQYEIEERTYSLNKQRQEMLEKEAQTQMEISELRLKIRQTDKYSAEERQSFMDEYLAKENSLMALKLDMAKKEYELWEMESAQDDNDYEANIKGAQLKAAIYQQQMEHSNNLAAMDKRRLALVKEMQGEESKGASESSAKVKEAKSQEIKAIEDAIVEEKNLLTQNYIDGEISKSLYHKRLEDLEMESLNRKLEIYNLDLEARKKIEDQILEYRKQLFEKGENVKLPLPSTDDTQKYYDELAKIRDKAGKNLSASIKEDTDKQTEACKNQAALAEKYQDIANGASQSFGNIVGGFISNTTEASENFEYEMLNLALDTLEQMMLVWYAQIIGNQVSKLGPILGPVAASAGMGIIQGVFAGVKSKIKKPSSKGTSTSDTYSDSSSSNRTISVSDGYASGGYTGYGDILEPAGIVHKREYVIPAWQMELPETISMVKVLEATRQRGIGYTSEYEGFVSGGYTGNNSDNDSALYQIIDLLKQIYDNPIQAYVLISDYEKQKLRLDRAKKISKK